MFNPRAKSKKTTGEEEGLEASKEAAERAARAEEQLRLEKASKASLEQTHKKAIEAFVTFITVSDLNIAEKLNALHKDVPFASDLELLAYLLDTLSASALPPHKLLSVRESLLAIRISTLTHATIEFLDYRPHLQKLLLEFEECFKTANKLPLIERTEAHHRVFQALIDIKKGVNGSLDYTRRLAITQYIEGTHLSKLLSLEIKDERDFNNVKCIIPFANYLINEVPTQIQGYKWKKEFIESYISLATAIIDATNAAELINTIQKLISNLESGNQQITMTILFIKKLLEKKTIESCELAIKLLEQYNASNPRHPSAHIPEIERESYRQYAMLLGQIIRSGNANFAELLPKCVTLYRFLKLKFSLPEQFSENYKTLLDICVFYIHGNIYGTHATNPIKHEAQIIEFLCLVNHDSLEGKRTEFQGQAHHLIAEIYKNKVLQLIPQNGLTEDERTLVKNIKLADSLNEINTQLKGYLVSDNFFGTIRNKLDGIKHKLSFLHAELHSVIETFPSAPNSGISTVPAKRFDSAEAEQILSLSPSPLPAERLVTNNSTLSTSLPTSQNNGISSVAQGLAFRPPSPPRFLLVSDVRDASDRIDGDVTVTIPAPAPKQRPGALSKDSPLSRGQQIAQQLSEAPAVSLSAPEKRPAVKQLLPG